MNGCEAITAPMVQRRIPWAVVLGNHDDEYDKSRENILLKLNDIEFNYTQFETEGIYGTGNYVRAWENRDKKPVGVKNEEVCAPAVNSGMFHLCTELHWYTGASPAEETHMEI